MPYITMEDLPPDAQARVRKQWDKEDARKSKNPINSDGAVSLPAPAEITAKGTRTKHTAGEMNKLETRYMVEVLEPEKKRGQIYQYSFERLKLKLADNSFYTPDFFVMRWTGAIEIHEVKGFMEDDAARALRFANEAWPFVFRLITWDAKSKVWISKTVGETW